MANLSGHAAGNGGYRQGDPTVSFDSLLLGRRYHSKPGPRLDPTRLGLAIPAIRGPAIADTSTMAIGCTPVRPHRSSAISPLSIRLQSTTRRCVNRYSEALPLPNQMLSLPWLYFLTGAVLTAARHLSARPAAALRGDGAIEDAAV